MGHSLTEFMYRRYFKIAEKPEAVTENETVEEAEDKFDESSDKEVDDGLEVSTLAKGEIGSSATFLLGARTRFVRAMRQISLS